MDFKKIINDAGLGYRSIQHDFADKVYESMQDGKVGLIQADTGVGKTLGYLIPSMIQAAKNKERVIIGIGTINLIKQINNKEIHTALKAVEDETGVKLSVSTYIGQANYISFERLERALLDIGSTSKKSYEAELNILRGWKNKPIHDYIDTYGELPCGLKEKQICQIANNQNDDFSSFQKEKLLSDVVITTHAMLAQDAFLRGSIFHNQQYVDTDTPVHLIIDEADHFHSVLSDFMAARFNLHDFYFAIKGFAPTALQNTVKQAGERITKLSDGSSFTTSAEIKSFVEDTLKQIQSGLAPFKDDQEAERAFDMIAHLNFAGMKEKGIGVSSVNGEPSIVHINPFATRVCGGYLDELYYSANFISATLSTHDDLNKGMKWLIGDLKLTKDRLFLCEFNQDHFGEMSIHLQRRDSPKPFLKDDRDVRINPLFINTCAQDILDAPRGNKLILTGSHQEAKLLFSAIKAKSRHTPVTLHHQGEKLEAAKNKFLKVGGLLITPAGHAGLDIRSQSGGQFLDAVVITRIPYSRKDSSAIDEFAAHLKSAGFDGHATAFASRVFMQRSANEAVRKVKQAIGRGIRGENDKVAIFILDPRFPLYLEKSSFIANQLKSAFPKRFKNHYAQAQIIGQTLPVPVGRKAKKAALLF